MGGNRKGTFATYLFAALFFTGIFFAEIKFLHFSYLLAAGVTTGILLLFLLPAIIEKNKKGVATNFNLLTIMLLGGFWHGANWNFIFWGALHGTGLVIHKIWVLITGKKPGGIKDSWWYNAIMICITFHFVCFAWIFFKAADFATATAMLHQIQYDFSFNVWGAFYKNYQPVLAMLGIAFLIHTIPDNFADKLLERFTKIPMVAYVLVFFMFIVLYGFFKSAQPVLPIYLQF